MSSKSERRARSVQRMKKMQMKSLSKKRKNDESDSDDGDDDPNFMPSPREFTDKFGRRGQVESLKKKKKKQKTSGSGGDGSRSSLHNLQPPDFSGLKPIEKLLWKGVQGDDNPSEELKAKRKNIGVLVRGNLSLCPPPVVKVDDKALPQLFAKVFQQLGITKPSPIQMQCWPAALCGADVLAIAPTGSGKTLAYVLPMGPHIEAQMQAEKGSNTKPAKASPFALVLVPTRELAGQVTAALKPLKKCSTFGLRAVAVYGGQDKDSQIGDLQSEALHVIVATPGRLLDLLSSKKISLSKVTYLVIDEADRMLAMGFYDQLEAISSMVRPDRQTLLFTATFPGKLREVAESWVKDAVTIRCNTMEMQTQPAQAQREDVEKKEHGDDSGNEEDEEEEASDDEGNDDDGNDDDEDEEDDEGNKDDSNDDDEKPEGNDNKHSTAPTTTASTSTSLSLTISPTVTQTVHVCASHKKPRLLIRHITTIREKEKTEKVRQHGAMLIFATKIKTVKFVIDFLKRQKVQAEMLHGQLPQQIREKTLADFKAGKIHTLVCTDVAARGIHIKRLQHVVNYDFPSNLEQYCHRVGRTGRQGAPGYSYSLVTRNMAPLARDLIALLKSTGQAIEPNLEALASEFLSGKFVFDTEDEHSGGPGTGDGEEA